MNSDALATACDGRVEDTPSAAQIGHAIWATRFQFAALGIFSGAWGVHIPSVKARFALDEMTLSLVLMSVAVGAVLSLLFAGRLIGAWGPRRVSALAAVLMGCLLGLVLYWSSLPWLLLAMVVFGASMSLYDVSINTEGSALESLGQRAIMGNLHGMFSCGGMLGALFTGVLIRFEVPAAWQLAGLGLGLAGLSVLAARWMLVTHTELGSEGPKAHFAWPSGTLLLIGLLAFAGMSAEGVMYDWCVLYLKQVVKLPQDQAAIGYAAFSAAMAITRFSSDALRSRYRERSLLRIGGGTSAMAMLAVLLSASPWVSMVGFALVGAGLAMVVPILFNAATRVPGTTRAAAIASVSSIGYSGFLVGPPLVGSIAQGVSLSAALGLVVLASGLLAWGASFVPEQAPIAGTTHK